MEGSTFRFHFSDSDPDNETPLFDAGDIQIEFLAATWADEEGEVNTADTDEFTVRDGSGGQQLTRQPRTVAPSGPADFT
jgi:hypothetical protein